MSPRWRIKQKREQYIFIAIQYFAIRTAHLDRPRINYGKLGFQFFPNNEEYIKKKYFHRPVLRINLIKYSQKRRKKSKQMLPFHGLVYRERILGDASIYQSRFQLTVESNETITLALCGFTTVWDWLRSLVIGLKFGFTTALKANQINMNCSHPFFWPYFDWPNQKKKYSTP